MASLMLTLNFEDVAATGLIISAVTISSLIFRHVSDYLTSRTDEHLSSILIEIGALLSITCLGTFAFLGAQECHITDVCGVADPYAEIAIAATIIGGSILGHKQTLLATLGNKWLPIITTLMSGIWLFYALVL